MTESEAINTLSYLLGYENAVDKGELDAENHINSQEKEALQFILEEIQQYGAIGTVEELQDLKEKNNKDFQLLLKCVKESYPIFKGAYVELDVFMGDVMRRFTRDMKQY